MAPLLGPHRKTGFISKNLASYRAEPRHWFIPTDDQLSHFMRRAAGSRHWMSDSIVREPMPETLLLRALFLLGLTDGPGPSPGLGPSCWFPFRRYLQPCGKYMPATGDDRPCGGPGLFVSDESLFAVPVVLIELRRTSQSGKITDDFGIVGSI